MMHFFPDKGGVLRCISHQSHPVRLAQTAFRLSAGKCSRPGCGICASPLYYLVKKWSSHRMSCISESLCWTCHLFPFRTEPKVGTWDFQHHFSVDSASNDFGDSTAQPRNARGSLVDTYRKQCLDVEFRIAQEILPSVNKIRSYFGYGSLLIKRTIRGQEIGVSRATQAATNGSSTAIKCFKYVVT